MDVCVRLWYVACGHTLTSLSRESAATACGFMFLLHLFCDKFLFELVSPCRAILITQKYIPPSVSILWRLVFVWATRGHVHLLVKRCFRVTDVCFQFQCENECLDHFEVLKWSFGRSDISLERVWLKLLSKWKGGVAGSSTCYNLAVPTEAVLWVSGTHLFSHY